MASARVPRAPSSLADRSAMSGATGGCFVVLEGGEGVGKTTQWRRLADRLAAAGHDVVALREPGGTSAGDALRAVLLDPQSALTPETEALLFAASRAQLVREAAEKAAAELRQRLTGIQAPFATSSAVAAAAAAPAAVGGGGSVAAPAAVAVAAEKVAKRRGPKKLTDMTPEERAAHDAKVAERKAAKAAGASALEVAAKAAVPLPTAALAPVPVVAAPAPAPVAMAAPEPEAEAEAEDEEDSVELKIFVVDGQKYMRPWSSAAKDWATNDLWYTNKKGEKAAYWGELMDDGSVNADAEEPEFE